MRKDFIDNPFNQWPRPERMGDLEAGYRVQRERYMFNANLYWMNYKDQLVLTGELNDVGAAIRTNVDRSYRAGIELDFTGKLTDKLSWSGNLTLSRNKIKEFTEILYDYGDNWEFDPPVEVRRTFRNTDIAMSPNIIGGSVLTYMPKPERKSRCLPSMWVASSSITLPTETAQLMIT